MLKEIITSKAGFPFYTDYWKSYFCKMTGEQVKECLRIIFHFNETFEILESGDLAIEMVVTTIIGNIKRDAEKRTKQILANQENGSKGGRPPKDSKPKKTNPKPKITQWVPPSLQEVQDYCKSRGNSVNPKGFLDYYVAGDWKDAKGNSVKNWKQKLLSWEGRNQNTDPQVKDTILEKINAIAGFKAFKRIEQSEESASLYAHNPQQVSALSEQIKDQIKSNFVNKKIILR